MEPVTYLSGLTTVICGYLYFLYQGREVSYSSVLSSSLSARRQTLYVSRGFDIQVRLGFPPLMLTFFDPPSITRTH